MSKFKVGDKVALARIPRDYLGCIAQIYGERAVIKSKYIDRFHIDLDCLVLYDETTLSDDEIYAMLKPKLDNSVFNGCIKFNLPVIMGFDGMEKVRCYRENEVIKAIALAYRSGYLRAKKGRPFKIGGEKD